MSPDEESAEPYHDFCDGALSVTDGGGEETGANPADFQSVERDGEAFRALFDSTTVSPTVAVACAVAELSGKDPLDVGPLSSSVDASALDALLQPCGSRINDVHVQFSVDGYDVDVTSYGRVSVHPTTAVERSC